MTHANFRSGAILEADRRRIDLSPFAAVGQAEQKAPETPAAFVRSWRGLRAYSRRTRTALLEPRFRK